MDTASFTPIPALIGGLLIGLSAAILWLGNGRIAGISGIFGQLLPPSSAEAKEVKERLALYEARKPYRQPGS